jgi:hypothetical protein
VIDDAAIDVGLDPPPGSSEPAAGRDGFPGAAGLFLGLLALLALPLVVALVALRRPHWYPLLDMAQTEIRIRDITGGHPPLIGLAGRIGPFGPDGGSHPGPLSFYALWPVWKVFGGSAYGMYASTVVLDIVAIGLSLWMALRRGGRIVLLGIAAVLAVLMHAYGAYLLTLPWNPYLPVLWWFVFVLAVWSVLDDDLAMLPVAVVAGSICSQTHISYLGLVGGLVVLGVLGLVRFAFRHRGDVSARRALWRWSGISALVGVVLWIPPVIDEIAHSPGNLTIIRDYFSHPPDSPIGVGRGVGVLLSQLNPWSLIAHILVHDGGGLEVTGSRVPGAILLIVFAASVVVAWRLRERVLLALDVVLVVALALGLVSSARIFGTVWFYLLLWAWGLCALILFAIGWSVVALVRTRDDAEGDRPNARRNERIGSAVLFGLTLLMTIVFAAQATNVTVQSPRLNRTLGALVDPTAAALRQLETKGQKGPYLVTWLPDAEAIGSAGYGLLNELDRRGFDVRAGQAFRPGATRYHVIDDRTPSLEVHLATGADIANWKHKPRFREVASFDPRSTAERATFDALHAQVIAELERVKQRRLAAQVDDNLFMLGIVPGVPAPTRKLVTRMLDLGMPMAVFIGPPTSG